MNTKLSGCQLVLVEIKRLGRNYFPFVENIRSNVLFAGYGCARRNDECRYVYDAVQRVRARRVAS